MEEKVILAIEIKKGQGEAEVDKLTRKITDLQVATANLQKQNNELIKAGKQNSEEYVENTRQIEINKQKINEASSARKGLIQTLTVEENSIKALRVANANLIKTRDGLNTSTKEGRAEIARLNAEIDRNNEAIEDSLDKAGKQKAAIGGYKDAIKDSIPFFRQAEQAQAALTGGVKGFTKALIATGIGLFVIALTSLIAYLKGSEEGQDKLNRIMQVAGAIMGKVMDVVRDLGEAIFNAFTNPQQALDKFTKFLEENIENRVEGLLELFPALGKAISLAFSGEFAAAGKVAVDAVAKVGLGIENITDKTEALINNITDLANTAIDEGNRVAVLQKQIRDAERKLQIDSANTALEVAKLKEKAITQEGAARIKTIEQAIALEQKLANQGVKLAEQRFELAKVEDAIADNTIEDNNKLIQAEADLINARRVHFDETLKLQKQLQSAKEEEIRLNEAAAKRQADLLAEANKILDENEKLEIERQARIRDALNETEQLRLEQAVVNAESLQARIDNEIELEVFKAFTLLENEKLIDEERQLIIEKSQANINGIIKKGNEQRAKEELAAEKKLADEKKKLRDQETQGREAAADAAVGFARAAFGETKGVAIAEATVNTIKGVARALSDYIFPYSLIVGALVGAAGAVQINKIINTKAAGGMLIKKFFGGGKVSRTGTVLRGPLHRNGGIPFTVSGVPGFEAEGGEAIINRKSTKMFRPLLSKINQAGGGVAFGSGGVTRFQTGGIGATQTRQAFQAAESRSAIRDTVQSVMENMPPIFVTVEDINARAGEVAEQSNKAFIV